jgi:hypothetical protein
MSLTSTLALLWLVFNGRKLLGRFDVRSLVTIALFGASTFVAVKVPNIVFDDLVRAVMGPFSFFVIGLFNELLLYTLILALVILIPRPGAVALCIAVRFLLSSLVLGNFTLIGLLSAVSEVIVIETVLYLVGATRHASNQSDDYPWQGRYLYGVGFACGLGQVLNSYVGFNLMTFLNRLFYADWYLLIYFLICGIGYTTIGAIAGVRLGTRLRKVID